MTQVLVVDDEAPIRRLLMRWLATWGYEGREAGNADEALTQMASQAAAIVLCDIHMPGCDGLWLATQVRQKWPHTAIIMVTGESDIEVVLRVRSLGAVDYVTKPLGREMVRQALGRAERALSAASESGNHL